MPLSLVLGPANSAKAGEVLGAYAAAARRDAVLVVPTALDAEHYARELAAEGNVLGSVLTFSGLVGEIAARTGTGGKRLSAIARRRVLRRVCQNLGLKLLCDSAAAAGFPAAAAALVAELERSLITPQRFAQALSAWGAQEPARAAYAAEVARIPLAYAHELDRLGCVDEELRAWRAIDALRARPAAWGETVAFFYGFDDLLGIERDAIETLARVVGCDVTVSLTYEPGRAALSARAEVVEELRAVASEVRELPPLQDHYAPQAREPLHHLERWLFDTPPSRPDPGEAVVLLEAGGELAQAELVAAEILSLRAGGVPGAEIAVVCRSLAAQAPVLLETFARYGIAWAGERRVPLHATRLGRVLQALARCAFDPDAAAGELITLLRAPAVAGEAEAVDAFEARLRRERIRTAAAAEQRWDESVQPLAALRGAADPAAELARQASILLSAPHRGQAEQLDGDAAIDARAVSAVLVALEEARQLGERLSPMQLLELLEDVEADAGQPVREGAVLVAEPLSIRARRFAAVIVCGLGEGEFPLPGGAEPFLSDQQRWELAGAAGLRLASHEDALDRERYLFYACVSRAARRLVLTYRSSDEEGNLALPSPFVADVADLFAAGWSERRGRRLLADVVWPQSVAPTERERARSRAAALGEAVRTGGGSGEGEAGSGRRLSEAALGVVRHRHVLSAGALETFAACPVKWLVERQLAPEQLVAESEGMVRGNVMHSVLQAVFDELGGPLTPRTLPAALQIVRRELSRAPAAVGAGAGMRAAVLAGYEADLRRYLTAESQDELDWPTLAVEQRFGFDEDSLPELRLGEGPDEVRLRGVIDRIDVDPHTGRQAIVRDYKSGGPRTEHPGARWISDNRPQAALYMLAVRELLGLEPVGGFFQPLAGANPRPRGAFRGDVVASSRTVDSDARDPEELDGLLAAAEEWAVEVTARLRSGELTPCPQSCSREGCRYPGICRSG